jgi:hypothetical protein
VQKQAKFFLIANSIWLVIVVLAMVGIKAMGATMVMHVNLIQSVTAGVLIISIFTLVTRYERIIPLLRPLIYAVLLGQGVLVLFSIKSLSSLTGAASLLISLLFVVYLIGFRGYLASNDAKEYFQG